MKMLRPACIVLLLSVAARAEQPESLSLDRAVAIALGENRVVRSAALDVQRADDRVAARRAQRWPALNLDLFESRLLSEVKVDFPMGVFGVYPSIGPVPARDTTLVQERKWTTTGFARAAQPLSQLYKIGLGVKMGELEG